MTNEFRSFGNEIGGFGSLFDISNYKIKDPALYPVLMDVRRSI